MTDPDPGTDMANTDHLTAVVIAQACAKAGVRRVVISPGSRSAPLVLAFHRHPELECLIITDERSAGFFALGIALQSNAPVALVCTSGTAVLNYAPACAEAFYQHVPLLFISADRPSDQIDIGDGQTIRQRNCLSHHTVASFALPDSPLNDPAAEQQMRALVGEAMVHLSGLHKGPVHLNSPFREPLYGTRMWTQEELTTPSQHATAGSRWQEQLEQLKASLNEASRIMLLVGSIPDSSPFHAPLKTCVENWSAVMLTESLSGTDAVTDLGSIDRILPAILRSVDEYMPDLLITVGGSVVSKRIKHVLRQHGRFAHWHIGANAQDTFGRSAGSVEAPPEQVLKAMAAWDLKKTNDFRAKWRAAEQRTRAVFNAFVASAPYCDLKVFEILLGSIPEGSDVHLANSTPVRYVQLFDRYRGLKTFSNRGTSGIDGCTSTAAGWAYSSKKLTTLITGDIAFLYDTNGLWSDHLSNDLRIIVIDNGGGNIFRYIDGPDTLPELIPYFETPHQMDLKAIAAAYGMQVYFCDALEDLRRSIDLLYQAHETPAVLLIKTDPIVSPRILRQLFNALSQA